MPKKNFLQRTSTRLIHELGVTFEMMAKEFGTSGGSIWKKVWKQTRNMPVESLAYLATSGPGSKSTSQSVPMQEVVGTEWFNHRTSGRFMLRQIATAAIVTEMYNHFYRGALSEMEDYISARALVQNLDVVA